MESFRKFAARLVGKVEGDDNDLDGQPVRDRVKACRGQQEVEAANDAARKVIDDEAEVVKYAYWDERTDEIHPKYIKLRGLIAREREEARRAAARRAEARRAEASNAEATNAGVGNAEAGDAEATDSEISDAEANSTEASDVEVSDAEVSDVATTGSNAGSGGVAPSEFTRIDSAVNPNISSHESATSIFEPSPVVGDVEDVEYYRMVTDMSIADFRRNHGIPASRLRDHQDAFKAAEQNWRLGELANKTRQLDPLRPLGVRRGPTLPGWTEAMFKDEPAGPKQLPLSAWFDDRQESSRMHMDNYVAPAVVLQTPTARTPWSSWGPMAEQSAPSSIDEYPLPADMLVKEAMERRWWSWGPMVKERQAARPSNRAEQAQAADEIDPLQRFRDALERLAKEEQEEAAERGPITEPGQGAEQDHVAEQHQSRSAIPEDEEECLAAVLRVRSQEFVPEEVVTEPFPVYVEPTNDPERLARAADGERKRARHAAKKAAREGSSVLLGANNKIGPHWRLPMTIGLQELKDLIDADIHNPDRPSYYLSAAWGKKHPLVAFYHKRLVDLRSRGDMTAEPLTAAFLAVPKQEEEPAAKDPTPEERTAYMGKEGQFVQKGFRLRTSSCRTMSDHSSVGGSAPGYLSILRRAEREMTSDSSDSNAIKTSPKRVVIDTNANRVLTIPGRE